MYLTVKILHILAWTSWMAGLFYLPRIFVYHAERANQGGPTAETFKVMEDKLLRLIMRPAMIVTWATGLLLVFVHGAADWRTDGWLWIKIALVVVMTGFHHMLGKWRKEFARDGNVRSGRYYRVANEVPTLLFVIIVIMVIARPL
ncbi:MAG: protoporphyrinogen oxidase HemJ [Rubrimonas sp.]